MIINSKPYEEVHYFVPAAAAPAAADGILTVTTGVTFKMNEIDKVDDAVATDPGDPHTGTITLQGGVTAGAEYVLGITGRHRDSSGILPISAKIFVTAVPTPSLTTVAAQIVAAINAKLGYAFASNVAGVITLAENVNGPSFKAALYTNDPAANTALHNLLVTVPGLYPSGLQTDVQALLPNVPPASISGPCDLCVVWTKKFRTDGGVEKQKNYLWCLGAGDAAAIKTAVTIGPTNAGDQSGPAQTIDVV
jgi:hypothetical protein